MYKTVLPYALVLFVCLIACKKDTETSSTVPELSGIYDASPVIEPGPLALYTTSGKITDQAFIKGVIQRKVAASTVTIFPGFPTVDSTMNITPQPFPSRDTFNINFNDAGRISLNRSYESRFTEIISTAPYIVLKEFDSTFTGPYRGIIEKTLAPVNQYSCVLVSSPPANQLCKGRYIFGFGYKDGKLYMPQTCMLYFTAKSDFKEYGRISFRFPNDNVVTSLVNYDTLILQENRRALIKR